MKGQSLADKWFARLHSDYPTKSGKRKNVFLQNSKDKKRTVKRNIQTPTNRDPSRITPVSDAAPDATPNEIHVGGNHLYYEQKKNSELITYAEFRMKAKIYMSGKYHEARI